MYLLRPSMFMATTMSTTLGVVLARQVAAFSNAMQPARKNGVYRLRNVAFATSTLRQGLQRRTRSGCTMAAGRDPPVFDFETVYDRSSTGALKWDKYGGKDVIPMWVADMELRTAPVILNALRARIEHGIFGYTNPTPGVQEAVMRYYKASAIDNYMHSYSSAAINAIPPISETPHEVSRLLPPLRKLDAESMDSTKRVNAEMPRQRYR